MKERVETVPESISNQRRKVEKALAAEIKDTDTGYLVANCYTCGRVKMTFSRKYGWMDTITGEWIINWREQMLCPKCRLNGRMRVIVERMLSRADEYTGKRI